MSLDSPINAAHAAALARWDQPFPGFASGHDRRTSDRGLLTLLYGGLQHAARYEWLNAGRRLIDRTYIDMLWQVQGLNDLRSVRAQQIAAALDPFITDVVRPVWADLPQLTDEERLQTSVAWVEQMAGQCFGSVYNEPAASHLMFFLFPMLPLFNLSPGHLRALDKVGHRPVQDSYRAFAQAASSAYREQRPRLMDLPSPAPTVSDSQHGALIEDLLAQTDWWARRVFDEFLRASIRCDNKDATDLFASGEAGDFSEDAH